jgi:hypothetical protein
MDFRKQMARIPFQTVALAMNGMYSPSGLQEGWYGLVWMIKSVSTIVSGSEIRNVFPDYGKSEYSVKG